MLIQVNTDDNIAGGEKFSRYVETEIARLLSRFSDQLTRIEIHLSDENAAKSGGADKRCLMEARPTSHQPVSVTHDATTLEDAFTGAAKKLLRLLESDLGRKTDHKGGASIRTADIIE
jgi:ribosome-associated translation inhibitor RaiA